MAKSRVDVLKKGFLFQSFSASEMEFVLSDLITERKIPKGKDVFPEGEASTSLFIVEDGSIDILKAGASGTNMVITTLKSGDLLGEMGFVDREPRAATAHATENSHLLEISYEDLEKFILSQPLVGLKIYQAISETLCDRIRRTTADLTAVLLS